ncbi:MAG: DUF3046 domain-containing protein [Nocardioides sp.]
MRLTEFWARMEDALGEAYAASWAAHHALTPLQSRTVNEALADGVAPKEIWAAVWTVLELPEASR